MLPCDETSTLVQWCVLVACRVTVIIGLLYTLTMYVLTQKVFGKKRVVSGFEPGAVVSSLFVYCL